MCEDRDIRPWPFQCIQNLLQDNDYNAMAFVDATCFYCQLSIWMSSINESKKLNANANKTGRPLLNAANRRNGVEGTAFQLLFGAWAVLEQRDKPVQRQVQLLSPHCILHLSLQAHWGNECRPCKAVPRQSFDTDSFGRRPDDRHTYWQLTTFVHGNRSLGCVVILHLMDSWQLHVLTIPWIWMWSNMLHRLLILLEKWISSAVLLKMLSYQWLTSPFPSPGSSWNSQERKRTNQDDTTKYTTALCTSNLTATNTIEARPDLASRLVRLQNKAAELRANLLWCKQQQRGVDIHDWFWVSESESPRLRATP